MSRRNQKIQWRGPLPHRGDHDLVWRWQDTEKEEVEPEPDDAWLHWWPNDLVESDRWAEETLRVVRMVWGRQGAKLMGLRGQQSRQDMHDWLITRAMEFRARYVPDESSTDPLSTWCAVLYANLTPDAQHYFRDTARFNDTHSLDQLQGWQRDAPAPGDRAQMFGRPVEAIEPPAYLILIEALEHQIDPRGVGGYKSPDLCQHYLCQKPATRVERTLCSTHASLEARIQETRLCIAEGCEKTVAAANQCQAHYVQTRAADLNVARCVEDGCGKAARTRGLCETHYVGRLRNGGTLPPTKSERLAGRTCSDPDCDVTKMAGRGMCAKHYKRVRRQEARDAA